ncbi:elongation factor P-like protein YeiP, partial [Escherichia coli]
MQHAPQPGRHSIRCSLKVNHRIDERAQYHLFCTSKSAN